MSAARALKPKRMVKVKRGTEHSIKIPQDIADFGGPQWRITGMSYQWNGNGSYETGGVTMRLGSSGAEFSYSKQYLRSMATLFRELADNVDGMKEKA